MDIRIEPPEDGAALEALAALAAELFTEAAAARLFARREGKAPCAGEETEARP